MTSSTSTVRTQDGIDVSVAGYQDGPTEAETAVLVCPGFFKSKETRTFKRLALALLAPHRDVICMDFRGHGQSGGSYTFSANEGADLSAVLEWLKPHYRRIGVIGFSLGGAVALNTVGRHRDCVRSVVAVSSEH